LCFSDDGLESVVDICVSVMMALKVLLMSVVGGLAVLLKFEVQNDILYVEKEVVLPSSRAKTFLYLSDLKNLKLVSSS